eukprot:COSAG04_NODE_5512_length_1589_cov_1.474497_1_plen_182_part_00
MLRAHGPCVPVAVLRAHRRLRNGRPRPPSKLEAMDDDDEDEIFRQKAMALCVATCVPFRACLASHCWSAAGHVHGGSDWDGLTARYKTGGGKSEVTEAAKSLTGGKRSKNPDQPQEKSKDDVRTMFDSIDEDGQATPPAPPALPFVPLFPSCRRRLIQPLTRLRASARPGPGCLTARRPSS